MDLTRRPVGDWLVLSPQEPLREIAHPGALFEGYRTIDGTRFAGLPPATIRISFDRPPESRFGGGPNLEARERE